jgi:2-dehydro-3-deoxygalactonokinase
LLRSTATERNAMRQFDLIAVDWGTTNRRAYGLDAKGVVVDRMSDARGILSVEAGGFPAAVAEIRQRLGDGPMLLAGMIGSNRGWVEAPYVPCPAGLPDLVAGLVRVEAADAAIVPGVAQGGAEPDIMRGEEVQLLGAVAAGLAPADATACHPGTHAKWVRMRDGTIDAFRTVMTGELFALLKSHSILSSQLQANATAGEAFRNGVRRSLERAELSADLFGVRTRGLIGALEPEDAASYASGLLIGADIRIGLNSAEPGQAIVLIGDGRLTSLYAAALEEAGRPSSQVDGETAFLAGIKAVAEQMA